jgi:3',5'-cyclic AMP phosphodiesterase CpdA
MLKFIHLTDTHLIEPGCAIYGSDPAWRLRQAVASINAEHADAAFVIVTGDLAHWGQPEAYASLREELRALTVPVHLLVGNHDDRVAFRQAFDATPTDPDGFVQYAFSLGGIRHIALDSNEPGVSWGVFCEQRARWLAYELSVATEPVHLYIHHPPCPVGIGAMDRIALRDTTPLRGALSPYKARLRHLFFGHLHRPIAGSWRGIPLSTVRATNHQVALHLGDSAQVPGSFEPPQYGVVLADAEQTIVHLHDFGDRSARFPL